MYTGKTSKNTLEQLVFRLFLVFDKKTCVFTGKFLAMWSKLLSTCPEENLQSNISQRKSWKLQILILIQKTLSRKVFSRVVTTAIRASRGIFWLKVIFLGKVIFVHLFWSLSKFFCLLTKKIGSQRNNLLIQKKKLEVRICRKIVF